jgi:hypothetical protein
LKTSKTLKTDGGRPDQRTVASETGRHDARAAGELKTGGAVEFALRCVEKELPETEGNRSGHDGQAQVEEVGD